MSDPTLPLNGLSSVRGKSVIARFDGGMLGGFKRSSQHQGVGGCDGHSKAAVGSVWASTITVTGSASCGGAR